MRRLLSSKGIRHLLSSKKTLFSSKGIRHLLLLQLLDRWDHHLQLPRSSREEETDLEAASFVQGNTSSSFIKESTVFNQGNTSSSSSVAGSSALSSSRAVFALFSPVSSPAHKAARSNREKEVRGAHCVKIRECALQTAAKTQGGVREARGGAVWRL